jgi:hypothetical protein
VLFWLAALGSAGAVYMKGDYGDVCRAIGVAVMLLTQRTAFMRFLVRCISQVSHRSSMLLYGTD